MDRARRFHAGACERVCVRVRRVRTPDAERNRWRGPIAGPGRAGARLGQLVEVLIRIGEACGAVTVVAALAIDRPSSGRRRPKEKGKRERRKCDICEPHRNPCERWRFPSDYDLGRLSPDKLVISALCGRLPMIVPFDDAVFGAFHGGYAAATNSKLGLRARNQFLKFIR